MVMVPDSVYVLISKRSAAEPNSPFWLGEAKVSGAAKPFIVMSSRSSEGSEESCRIVGELYITSASTETSAVLSVDEADVNLNEVRNASDLSEELQHSLDIALSDFFGASAKISKSLDFNSIDSIYR